MSITVERFMFQSLEPESSASETLPYWWLTSGRDLSRMLQEAQYPEDTQRHGVGWDGNPFEYGFELKSSGKDQAVRFVVDVSPLRPADDTNPLDIKNFEVVLDALSKKTPGFDDTWYTSLRKWFVHSHRSTAEQKDLVAQAGYQMPMILGFDIGCHLPIPDAIPVMAKVYFPPCFTAVAEGITRWEAVRRGTRREYENGPRYLATDFVTTEKARLKIYMRHPAESFDDIWDYYTLGGRISDLDEDKEKFRELVSHLVQSGSYPGTGR
ncbi:uncharacterized protein ATNIH1004_011418 [Aspergillus tanneri]|uniref:Aromatic prenyltransferase (DMATS family) n=1 Tax=Aspergillus tanneri TaxID=1220188 RepID=A0A5M9MC04_9EURO|nr:uncharacterized protein ATNIH1004_011418 [Aspergillus tanneri]KAA8642473.1 hypothetical protein ATNIH1004_011418 [Aspergillus tanneri]